MARAGRGPQNPIAKKKRKKGKNPSASSGGARLGDPRPGWGGGGWPRPSSRRPRHVARDAHPNCPPPRARARSSQGARAPPPKVACSPPPPAPPEAFPSLLGTPEHSHSPAPRDRRKWCRRAATILYGLRGPYRRTVGFRPGTGPDSDLDSGILVSGGSGILVSGGSGPQSPLLRGKTLTRSWRVPEPSQAESSQVESSQAKSSQERSGQSPG